jgi:hypothetical protein
VLQDDRHHLGELGQEPLRHAHAIRARLECDVEMVVARQAILGRILEHRLDDAAQRLLGEDVIADMIDSHGQPALVPTQGMTLQMVAQVEAAWIPASPAKNPRWALLFWAIVGRSLALFHLVVPAPLAWQKELALAVEVEASVARCLRTPPAGA